MEANGYQADLMTGLQGGKLCSSSMRRSTPSKVKLATALKASRKVAIGTRKSIIGMITGSSSENGIGAANQDELSGTDDDNDDEDFDQQSGVVGTPRRVGDTTTGEHYVAPMWANDASRDNCVLCERAFTFITRRHHCRYCGSIVCDRCSRHRLWCVPNLLVV